MKLSNILILLSSSLLLFSCSKDAATSSYKGPKRYGIKSGVIEYSLDGMQKGKETLYFDNFGMREAKHTQSEISMMGSSQKKNEIAILNQASMLIVDLIKKTAVKMENPVIKQLLEDPNKQDLQAMGKQMLEKMGGQNTGTDTVAGKTCEVWEVKSMGSKSCIWNGIPLRNETNMAGFKIMNVATKVQENVSIAPEKFSVPQGIVVSDGPDFSKMLGGNKGPN